MPRLRRGLARQIAAWPRRILSRMVPPQSAAASSMSQGMCSCAGVFTPASARPPPFASGVPPLQPLPSVGALDAPLRGLEGRGPVRTAPLATVGLRAPAGLQRAPRPVQKCPWRGTGCAFFGQAVAHSGARRSSSGPRLFGRVPAGFACLQGRRFACPQDGTSCLSPLRGSPALKSRGPLASLGRAGLRPPCAGRPLGGPWVSALRSRARDTPTSPLRYEGASLCHVPCLALIARRHRLRLPPALARGARGLRPDCLAPPSAAPRKIVAWLSRRVFDIVDCRFGVMPLITTRHPCRVMARIPGKTVNPGRRPFGS
jgi:hypothetical protein